MGKFKIKSKLDLSKINNKTVLEESDFFISTNDYFYQFEYLEDKKDVPVINPGIWRMKFGNSGIELLEAEFVNDKILENFNKTVEVERIADYFFDNLHVYKEVGIEVPKRAILLFGPPGTGKTISISKVAKKYHKDGKTAVLVWDTGSLHSDDVKYFISTLDFKNIDRLVFIIEDIGGNSTHNAQVVSDAALLALLDNNGKVFKKPTLIIGTTNYIHNLEQNIINRSGRFDDKIQVNHPSPEERISLLEFYAKKHVDNDTMEKCIELMKTSKTNTFTPAHIKELYIRSRIRNENMHTILLSMITELQLAKNSYEKIGSVGI